MRTIDATSETRTSAKSMQDNPIALIEFVAFMGFALWLFLRQH
jgi:hypothetical protein